MGGGGDMYYTGVICGVIANDCESRFHARTSRLTGGLQAYSGNFSMVGVSRSFLFGMQQS